jgi:hypothetical protein
MRDFRDAKTMAHTLRAALAADLGIKITNSQSLELIAEAFGVADWNTLSAAIRAETTAPRHNAAPPPLQPSIERLPGMRFSAELEAALHRALAHANQRKHQYATLEHLLLALADDVDASAVMRGCNVDLAALKNQLTGYLNNEFKTLMIDDGGVAKPTAAFQRVVQRAVIHVQGLGVQTVTGAQLVLALFAERESYAAAVLGGQGMTRLDAATFIAHGTIKGSRGEPDDP